MIETFILNVAAKIYNLKIQNSLIGWVLAPNLEHQIYIHGAPGWGLYDRVEPILTLFYQVNQEVTHELPKSLFILEPSLRLTREWI